MSGVPAAPGVACECSGDAGSFAVVAALAAAGVDDGVGGRGDAARGPDFAAPVGVPVRARGVLRPSSAAEVAVGAVGGPFVPAPGASAGGGDGVSGPPTAAAEDAKEPRLLEPAPPAVTIVVVFVGDLTGAAGVPRSGRGEAWAEDAAVEEPYEAFETRPVMYCSTTCCLACRAARTASSCFRFSARSMRTR